MNVNDTITGLLKMLKRLIGEDIEIHTDYEKNVWTVNADIGNFEQVLMNLAVNARDAMPEGGTLAFKTENRNITSKYKKEYPYAYTGQYVCISIQDTGTGINEETKEHIFEPFYTTKGAEKGTGLGMSVVYGIVREHGGWINLYSEPGQGALFRIYLPAVFKTLQEDSRKETTGIMDLRGKSERILLVEDEKSVLETTKKILEVNGYQAVGTMSAEEAIDIFKKEKGQFDLVFTDTILPGKNGLELIEDLRNQRPDLKVLLGSGYTGEKVQRDILREKAYPFMQKPYEMDELLTTLRKILAHP
jgi:CheY-like chemotaxis protein